MVIYLITNLLNGKVYVGQTIGSPQRRWWRHRREFGCLRLSRAIRKYGEQNFSFEIIDTFATTRDDLDRKEILYIKLFRANNPEHGYNLTEGGGGMRGYEVTPEHRKNLSKAQLGKPKLALRGRKHSPERVAKVVAAITGQKRTPEQRENMRQAHLGIPLSISHRLAMREANMKAGKRAVPHQPKISDEIRLRHPRKISDEQVREIRDAYSSGSCVQAQLADKYGVTGSQIYRIVNNLQRNGV